MDFDFSPEQYLLRDTVRDLLRRECTPAAIRASWASETGRSPERWRKLADLGVVGLTVAEEHGGAGMDEVDLVLILEEAGRSLLPEPLLETTAVGAPLIARCGSEALRAGWLARITAGDATVTVGLAGSPYVADATADLVVLERDGALHAVTQDRLTVRPLRSVDGARRIFSVTAELGDDTVLSTSAADARWAFDHAAAATAAELVGIAGAMLDMTVAYVKQREQFGRRIGSFQAVQHKLAETLLLVDSARSAVYYAAWALANDTPDASIAASVAKAYASDAERRANAEALQLHGGIGFTWEHDLHLWLKRGKALELQYGDADLHRRRIADWIYAPA
ncbi:MAG TPA: acyl-CoA dehydrogenase family protein [Candidatus Dormibacteraeota bacterium]|nr:acyl-CoA dehydrogenase family protein [Candidatus Dormibacteraeota bacterium]